MNPNNMSSLEKLDVNKSSINVNRLNSFFITSTTFYNNDLSRKDNKISLIPRFFSGWKGFVKPFNSWNEEGVQQTDLTIMTRRLEDAEEIIKELSAEIGRKTIQTISITAKNRAERISARSDFYPAFNTLIAAGFAFPTIYVPYIEVKVLLSLIALIFIIISIKIRTETRDQVADLKEIANMADILEKRLGK